MAVVHSAYAAPAQTVPSFGLGVATIFPLLFATAPIGLLFGALAAQKGLTPAEVFLMSSMVFAGGSQFVALDLWANPLPWFTIASSAFLVNLRHVLMGASLTPKIPLITGRKRMLGYFFLTDETWAFCEQKVLSQPVGFGYYMGISLPFFSNWVISSFIGAFIGPVMGDPATIGLDFAFTALFVFLVMSFWTGYRSGLVIAASGLTSVLVNILVEGAWYIIAGALAGMLVAAILAKPEASTNTAPLSDQENQNG
ncbi:branched-chain amino acid ABC transporter permease [Rhodobacteraceae bacterium RKSG542]|uniref:AzlC family ABC transporter permease n=1 Tax=Pseudovibrio flavus TaxID=2529854 RepID=UPI0012BC7A9A|nr:AzlC family ABC transporter permease [Pseudovibrio flavus]MTI19164.1 branched-chain amino acid ABC transporter permease [Pseudovibrio flavus]